MKQLAIIGSGAAGLTASIYAARANLKPVVFAGLEPGGQLTTTTDVENYPGFEDGIMGPALMSQMQAQAERFGAQIRYDLIEKVELQGDTKLLYTDSGIEEFEAVIIATGARPRLLGVPGEDRLWARGVSSCATCDGFFYRDKEIIVVGGGDSTMEEATFLTRFASRVHIVHRSESFRASKIMLKRAQDNPKISWHTFQKITNINGKDAVTSTTLENTQTGAITELPVAGVFLAIGHIPNTSFLTGSRIELDENGYICTQADRTLTAIAGVFACGDVQDHRYRQAITAAGSGCMAALDAQNYLAERTSLPAG